MSNRYQLTFHHLGLAVNDRPKALHFLKGLGYAIGDEIFDPLQNVNLTMCRSQTMPDVEVVSQSDGPSPLDNILKQNKDLIYHCCYSTPDLKATLVNIEQDQNKFICISPPKPAVLFSGKLVSFYLIKGFGIIEILEDPASERMKLPAARPRGFKAEFRRSPTRLRQRLRRGSRLSSPPQDGGVFRRRRIK
ncbi:MAG: VOC family protein [Deltaproteobacteria bacterium]|nr:VOC family protein [Deltaproteobacteria bacterium]